MEKLSLWGHGERRQLGCQRAGRKINLWKHVVLQCPWARLCIWDVAGLVMLNDGMNFGNGSW